ncbi:MAG: hypothetical protein ACI8Y3_001671 [Paraglaciecola sp.]|jgi:hypothetical protein
MRTKPQLGDFKNIICQAALNSIDIKSVKHVYSKTQIRMKKYDDIIVFDQYNFTLCESHKIKTFKNKLTFI